MLTKLGLQFLIGIIAHRSKSFFDTHFTGAWNFIGRCAFGVTLAGPGVIAIGDELHNHDERINRLIAYILGFVSIGAGVVVGYMLDAAMKTNESE